MMALPRAAMIFAAGIGSRMMPLTADRPKPMLEVAGQPLLGHALDRVAAAGITDAVVNAHHCPEVIRAYIPTRTAPQRITLAQEKILLETGGGINAALKARLLPQAAPLLAINADILWTDKPQEAAISRLSQRWQELGDGVDVLLLLTARDKAWGHDSPNGDYTLAADGRLVRLSSPLAPYVYAGVQLVHPRVYAPYAIGAKFSNLEIFDRAQQTGRLFGLVHTGGWYHFSTPQSLADFAREAA